MKAHKFLAEFGVDEAKRILAGANWENVAYSNGHYYSHSCSKNDVNLEELKQIVDSLELIINDFESVEIAEYEYMICGSQNEPYWIRLKQAIADHEYIEAIKKINGYGGIGIAKLIEQSVFGESLDLSKAISDYEAANNESN